ncbi:ABC transporter permease [Pullulanibacillus camelliae]|uniref:ABC transporter permease n=1 Tax=Pullulanibacillus camelliae TaxID=1707096 RepID=A0A8J2VLB0_9BACL|nr:sugar ABC transporter permease [Pullulanibacillus camelliae]GGE30914.1 ABC transporter permease [Pullulanibacillus camelliae]
MSEVTSKAQRTIKLKTRRALIAYGFLVIPLLFFLCIRIYPTLYAFSLSFRAHNASGFTLDNYSTLFHDHVFWRSVLNTLLYVIITVPLQMAFGLLIALGIEKIHHFRWFYRVIYFLPYITSIVAVSWVWRLMFDENTGVLNHVLAWFHIAPQGWLADPSEALLSVSIVMIWQAMGFSMLIFMAGIQAIPRQLYEAAQIDGSSSWKMFWRITFPLLNPTLVFLAVTGVISALQTFTQIQNLTAGGGQTAGGPLNSTSSMVVYMFNNAFTNFNMEYASAVTVTLFILILIVTLIQLKIINRSFDY